MHGSLPLTADECSDPVRISIPTLVKEYKNTIKAKAAEENKNKKTMKPKTEDRGGLAVYGLMKYRG